MSLKENYKDEILQSGQLRTYNMIDSNGGVLYSNIKLEKAYTPQQQGDNLSANDINAITKAINKILSSIHRVGDIIITTNDENPSNIYGGTWERYGEGRVLIGYDPNDSDYNKVGITLGNKSIELKAGIGAVNNNISSIGYKADTAIPGVNYNMGVYGTSGFSNIDKTNHSVPVRMSNGEYADVRQPSIVVKMWRKVA